MRKIIISIAAVAITAMIAACGTSQKTANGDGNDGKAAAITTQDTTVSVVPNSEVLSIKELIGVFADETNADEAMSKYGYKVKKGYEVFRVDKYDKVYYKNCRLPKIITDGKYEDYPRAMRQGVSSYVAVKGESMMPGVFNNNAYQNLVNQVKMNGFHLDMEGNEDIYTDGKYYIACNKSNQDDKDTEGVKNRCRILSGGNAADAIIE